MHATPSFAKDGTCTRVPLCLPVKLLMLCKRPQVSKHYSTRGLEGSAFHTLDQMRIIQSLIDAPKIQLQYHQTSRTLYSFRLHVYIYSTGGVISNKIENKLQKKLVLRNFNVFVFVIVGMYSSSYAFISPQITREALWVGQTGPTGALLTMWVSTVCGRTMCVTDSTVSAFLSPWMMLRISPILPLQWS